MEQTCRPAKETADHRLFVGYLTEAVFMQGDLCLQLIGQKGVETLLHKHTHAPSHTPFFSSPSVSASFPSSHTSAHSFALGSAALPLSTPLPPPHLSLLIGRRSEVARSPLPPLPHPSFQKNLRHTPESPNCIMVRLRKHGYRTSGRNRHTALVFRGELVI